MEGPSRRDTLKLGAAALVAARLGGRRAVAGESGVLSEPEGVREVGKLYGREIGKDTLGAYVGRMEQVAGIERFVYDDGKAAGVRAARVYTGSGLEFDVALDRGMDIPRATFGGAPLAWLSQAGIVGPQYYEPHGKGWDRTFFGGLVQTCGLRSAGHASVLDGEEFGLHGRISTTPAEKVNVKTEWTDDGYLLEVSGTMVQAHSHRENLTMRRTITTAAGSKGFTLCDEVVNAGPISSPHTIMYHINPGFPVLSEDSEILWSIDKAEGTSVKKFASFVKPGQGGEDGGYFLHKPCSDGLVRVAVVNRKMGDGFGFYIAYDPKVLPVMIGWKVARRHVYVLAIEPANCRVNTNKRLSEAGILPVLEPGQTRTYKIEFGVLSSSAEIEAFTSLLP